MFTGFRSNIRSFFHHSSIDRKIVFSAVFKKFAVFHSFTLAINFVDAQTIILHLRNNITVSSTLPWVNEMNQILVAIRVKRCKSQTLIGTRYEETKTGNMVLNWGKHIWVAKMTNWNHKMERRWPISAFGSDETKRERFQPIPVYQKKEKPALIVYAYIVSKHRQTT